jgi:ribosomal protein S18 acetylase RimI-like enzyme
LAAGEAFITLVLVDPKYRNKRVASAMLKAVHQHAAGKGFSSVRLKVLADNERAIRLYRTAGYTVVSADDDEMEMLLQLDATHSG